MTTLQEARDNVRSQVDLDEEDLPNAVVDGFIREGFDRTFSAERRWPSFQATWTLTLAPGDTTITLPTTDPLVSVIHRMRSDTNQILMQLAPTFAEDNLIGTSTADPSFFSVWGGELSLWPVPSGTGRTYTVRGFRKPTWTGVAADELDGDERLHQAIVHYAIALTYAQLEDTELEGTYMARWAQILDVTRRSLMEPINHEPMVLNGGNRLAGRNVGSIIMVV